MKSKKWRWAALVAPLLLAACGGGGGDAGGDACSVEAQKSWLAGYMDDWYFWYALSPRPGPAGYATVADYFEALLYTGSSAGFPADRWSNYESTADFNRFFGDGQALGYGVSVAGLEVEGSPNSPLYVRYVEPRSPAAGLGVQRGDQVMAVNGRSASDVIAGNDYSALTSANAGETLTLTLRRNGQDRTLVVTSAVYDLSPVPQYTVVTSAGGRRMGYVVVKDMIDQVSAPLETAFAGFRAQGVTEVVLDLRYNGGGLVSVGGSLASYVAGARGTGHAYAQLLYNDKHSAQNTRVDFASLGNALGLARVFVLTGERTCSASEQVVNGLRGVGVDVVTIGSTTCGKPVGFLPQAYCSTTYSVVNFESVNDRFEGRYFDGFAATCPVAEDFSQPLGSSTDPLLMVAASYADTGSCPLTPQARGQGWGAKAKAGRQRLIDEGGGLSPGMVVR